MDAALLKLKTYLCVNSANSRALRAQARNLLWKDNALKESQEFRSRRDSLGRRVVGKKALREFRRPETGPERHQLRVKTCRMSFDLRISFLTYGMLRGRPYAALEQRTKNPVGYNYTYIQHLVKHLYPGVEVTRESIVSWLSGGPAPKILPEAA